MWPLERPSGPDPRALTLPADDGGHVLFERGDTELQLLREVLEQATLLVHQETQSQRLRVLLHREEGETVKRRVVEDYQADWRSRA